MRPRLQFRAPQAATPISCVQVLRRERRRARPEAARGAAAGAQRLLLLARGPVRLVLPPLAPRAARPAQLGGGGARGRAARRAQRGGGVARAPAWSKSPCWQAAEQGLAACGSRRPRPRVRRPSGLRRRARAARAPRCRPGASPSRRRRRRFRCASPLRSSSLSASGRCSRRRGRSTVPPWWRYGLLPRPPGRHGFRSGLPCALPRHASAVQTAAAPPSCSFCTVQRPGGATHHGAGAGRRGHGTVRGVPAR
jgi:hypothetical protein